MKRLYISFFALLFAVALQAQTAIDTVLIQDFQDEAFGDTWELFPFGSDTTWVSYDADGLDPFDFNDYSKQWFQSEFFHFPDDTLTGVTNLCAASLSYMDGFAQGNRNWFIMPAVDITDDSYVFSWKSAPFQLPRYMDGYTVLVSETTNACYDEPNPFTDTLFQAASMTNIVNGDGGSVHIEDFAFSEGYIHADNLTNPNYAVLWEPGDSTLMRGLLEPHSVSLSQFAGKRIFIAFLHDSDDDYYIAIDDLLITKNNTTGTTSPLELELRFRTYPNPADQHLNVLYRLQAPTRVQLQITDMNGKVVRSADFGQQSTGEYNQNLYVADLPSGAYMVTLTTPQGAVSQVMTKR